MADGEPGDEQNIAAAVPAATEQESESDQLSTTPEEDSQDPEVASDYLQHADAEFEEILRKTSAHMDCLISAESQPVEHDDPSDSMPLSLLTASAESLILAPPIELNRETCH